VLVVDHKIPREWGGETVSENLEAICEDCNAGKKLMRSLFLWLIGIPIPIIIIIWLMSGHA